VHVEQRRTRLDLVGWATSDGAAHVLSFGYRGHTPTSLGPPSISRTFAPSTCLGKGLSFPVCWKPPVFQHGRPPRVGQTKSIIAKKRVVSARAPTDPTPRGRPRRSARSTYATALEDQATEEPAVEDQPSASEEQQAPNPTPKQEFQQLQAQLQNMQQERDRVAATFVANQRATQTSAQAATSRPTVRNTKYAAFAI